MAKMEWAVIFLDCIVVIKMKTKLSPACTLAVRTFHILKLVAFSMSETFG